MKPSPAVQDQNRLIGTGLGAVVGGLWVIRLAAAAARLATVAGAAAGTMQAIRFNKTQRGDTYTSTERRCSSGMTVKRSQRGLIFSMNTKEKHHLHLTRVGSLTSQRRQIVSGLVKGHTPQIMTLNWPPKLPPPVSEQPADGCARATAARSDSSKSPTRGTMSLRLKFLAPIAKSMRNLPRRSSTPDTCGISLAGPRR